MRSIFSKISARMAVALALLFTMSLPVFAMGNPNTGDFFGQFVWVGVGLVVVSAILIIVFIVTGKKKK